MTVVSPVNRSLPPAFEKFGRIAYSVWPMLHKLPLRDLRNLATLYREEYRKVGTADFLDQTHAKTFAIQANKMEKFARQLERLAQGVKFPDGILPELIADHRLSDDLDCFQWAARPSGFFSKNGKKMPSNPLYHAVIGGDDQTVLQIIEEGFTIPDLGGDTDEHNNTLLHHLAMHDFQGGTIDKILALACLPNVDLSTRNNLQQTALHTAIWKGQYQLAEKLLSYDKSKDLQFATYQGHCLFTYNLAFSTTSSNAGFIDFCHYLATTYPDTLQNPTEYSGFKSSPLYWINRTSTLKFYNNRFLQTMLSTYNIPIRSWDEVCELCGKIDLPEVERALFRFLDSLTTEEIRSREASRTLDRLKCMIRPNNSLIKMLMDRGVRPSPDFIRRNQPSLSGTISEG